MTFPKKILVIALGRINKIDTSNNGLLIRNLLSSIPRENLGQIYSSGDNGDPGFFKNYYQLRDLDRRFGSIFYKYKYKLKNINENSPILKGSFISNLLAKLFKLLNNFFVQNGLYELIFTPRISDEMSAWILDFKPDIIFAQGYNLTFAKLPILLKKRFNAKLAFLTTDDWPAHLYAGSHSESIIFRWLVRRSVIKASTLLMQHVDIPFAFGQPMAKEYEKRYGKYFITLNHSDCPVRFANARKHKLYPHKVKTIISIGTFNKYRWPLIADFNDACEILNHQDINVRVVLITDSIDPPGKVFLSNLNYVDIYPDPGNLKLPMFLKGADILLLAEAFDNQIVPAIELSISTKAHLFMFSKRPIIVYSHRNTGIAKYAAKDKWAKLISTKNNKNLSKVIMKLLSDKSEVSRLVNNASNVAEKYHMLKSNQKIFLKSIQEIN